eukprot:7810848-Heterocapsa_arctica.AAC.1
MTFLDPNSPSRPAQPGVRLRPSNVNHLWEPPDPEVLSEGLGLPSDFVGSIQFVLRLVADPLMVQPVLIMASADVPTMEFVFVLRQAGWAKER